MFGAIGTCLLVGCTLRNLRSVNLVASVTLIHVMMSLIMSVTWWWITI